MSLTFYIAGTYQTGVQSLNKTCVFFQPSIKGTISGTVINPFNGKAVELPTVWIKGTAFSSHKIPGGLPDGKFKFESIESGTYVLKAGKGKYSEGQAEFTITIGKMDVTQNIYIYGQEVNPGLYRTIENSNAEKITNDWAHWQSICKEKTGFALRTKFETEVENPQTRKIEKKEYVLPAPKNVPAKIVALYKITSSVSSPIEAISYPLIFSSAKSHADCFGVDEKETLLVPDMSKGVVLASSYKSDNLYEIKGNLISGKKQFLALSQNGKLVGLYYLNAQ